MDQQHQNLCAVILTALAVEYQAVRAHITHIQEEVHPNGTVYERGVFVSGTRQWDIGLCHTNMGNADAAFAAERAIQYFKPDLVLFVGVAGGIKSVKLGDVVAASKVCGYESGKADVEFKTRPDIGLPTYRLVERAKVVARNSAWHKRVDQDPIILPHAYVEPIVAGEKVISSTQSPLWKFLRDHYEHALAVEMEGYGFLKAMHANQQVEALVIRGISDLIDGKQEADSSGWQHIAARHASAFAFEVISHLTWDDFGNPSNSVQAKRPQNGNHRIQNIRNYTSQKSTSGPQIANTGDHNSSVIHYSSMKPGPARDLE